MSRSAVTIALTCVLVFSWMGASKAYDNPHYVEYTRKDGTIDTVGAMRCQSSPGLLIRNTLELEFYLPFAARDSVYIYPESGDICDFRWGQSSYTWYGDFAQGDTLRCSFSFTPLTVGTRVVIFRIEYGHTWGRGLGFAFTLDETGKEVPGEIGQGEKRYGLLGTGPGSLGDSVFYIGKCFETEHSRGAQDFCIQAKMSPPLGSDQYSEIVYTIIPTTDQDLGVFYHISHNDLFDLVLEDSTDWTSPVMAGDSLRVRVLVKPVKPGIGELSLTVMGFTGFPQQHSYSRARPSSRTKNALGITFAINESLEQIAYTTTHNLPLKLPPSTVSDSYRLPAIDALQLSTKRLVVTSKNWSTIGKELEREFRRSY